jgi:methionyl-tRNA formyltransferase
VDALRDLGPGLGVLADYGRIVPPVIVALPLRGILNVHPSLLPRHRGATPIPATIRAGDADAGVSIIRMDDGIDTGPIVAQERWSLDGTETTPELEARAAAAGAALLARTIGPWLAGELAERQQDEAGATLTRPLRRADGRLDPFRPVAELERQVRALQPWPGSWLETVVGRLIVWRAEAVSGFVSADAVAGFIGRFGLNASDGHLALREVQPAGGRRMTWDELVRGRPAIVGSGGDRGGRGPRPKLRQLLLRGGGFPSSAACRRACADQRMTSTASSRGSRATSVSQTKASIPSTLRIATARRRSPSSPSRSRRGSSASSIQPMARP